MLILKPTIERNYWAGYIFLHDASSFVLYGTKKWKMKYKLHKKNICIKNAFILCNKGFRKMVSLYNLRGL